MTSLEDNIDSLEKEEKDARSKSHIREIEDKWEYLVTSIEGRREEIKFLLMRYNCFRLRNLLTLRKKRPAILLGYVNDHQFPNFHTLELIKLADIVSLTTSVKSEEDKIDRIYYFPSTDQFSTIRKKFPPGFRPSLFLDMQAAHGHIHPLGLSSMPFPTVAGICHHQHGQAVKTICQMFDYVLPVGKAFSKSCSYGKAEVIDLPFGFNWASFHHSYACSNDWQSRDVDLSVTFSKSESPAYHQLRNQVINEVEKLSQKWGDKYRVEIKSNLDKDAYRDLLSNSKISLNVVAINGPHNYRTCEIINSGALLLQTCVEVENLTHSRDEVLKEGQDYVFFDLENLESKLLHFLEHKDESEKIISNAKHRMETELSYEITLGTLLSEIQSFEKKGDCPSKVQQDMFLLGSLLWQQHQNNDVQLLGSAFIGKSLEEEKDTIVFFSNLLAILPELLSSLGFESLKSLVARHSSELAESLDAKNLKQIAVQLLSVKMDHIALWYNFIALSMDFDWSPKEVLQQLVQQALANQNWEGYSSNWLLRVCTKAPGMEPSAFIHHRYQNLLLPLMKCSNKTEEWKTYAHFTSTLFRD